MDVINPRRRCHLSRTALPLLLVVALVYAPLAQTHIEAPKNKYTPGQDVELGLQAAAEAQRQLPMLNDAEVSSFVSRLNERLVDVIPPEFEHPEFRYSARVVNLREINAFALPGGPMFVHRGMIEAAATEGEVAGVMAHELSHVVLRHGTAQATKAQKYQLGALAGAILGAVIGGNVGTVVAEGSRFGLGAAFLRFSREYEKQADLLGAQMMARAGYDPRDLAHMFQTIEKQGGRGGPQWLSDHPNPGDRTAYITAEASRLRIDNPIRNSRDFARVQEHLRGMSPALSAEEATRTNRRAPSRSEGTAAEGRISTRVPPPSGRYTTYDEGDLFRVSVPSNWREVASSASVKFVPEGAYGRVGGQTVFTHGVEFGLTRNETHSLHQATEEFIDGLAQANPSMRVTGNYQNTTLDGRRALVSTLRNVSEVTGRGEIVTVYTTLLRDGNLFYCIAVAPEDEHPAYQNAFDRVTRSIRIAD